MTEFAGVSAEAGGVFKPEALAGMDLAAQIDAVRNVAIATAGDLEQRVAAAAVYPYNAEAEVLDPTWSGIVGRPYGLSRLPNTAGTVRAFVATARSAGVGTGEETEDILMEEAGSKAFSALYPLSKPDEIAEVFTALIDGETKAGRLVVGERLTGGIDPAIPDYDAIKQRTETIVATQYAAAGLAVPQRLLDALTSYDKDKINVLRARGYMAQPEPDRVAALDLWDETLHPDYRTLLILEVAIGEGNDSPLWAEINKTLANPHNIVPSVRLQLVERLLAAQREDAARVLALTIPFNNSGKPEYSSQALRLLARHDTAVGEQTSAMETIDGAIEDQLALHTAADRAQRTTPKPDIAAMRYAERTIVELEIEHLMSAATLNSDYAQAVAARLTNLCSNRLPVFGQSPELTDHMRLYAARNLLPVLVRAGHLVEAAAFAQTLGSHQSEAFTLIGNTLVGMRASTSVGVVAAAQAIAPKTT